MQAHSVLAVSNSLIFKLSGPQLTVTRLIKSQRKHTIQLCMSSYLDVPFLPFKFLNFPKIGLCLKPIFYSCGFIKNACQNMRLFVCFLNNVCTLNTSAKSFQQIFEHLLWARCSSEEKRQKFSWSLHSFIYLTVLVIIYILGVIS